MTKKDNDRRLELFALIRSGKATETDVKELSEIGERELQRVRERQTDPEFIASQSQPDRYFLERKIYEKLRPLTERGEYPKQIDRREVSLHAALETGRFILASGLFELMGQNSAALLPEAVIGFEEIQFGRLSLLIARCLDLFSPRFPLRRLERVEMLKSIDVSELYSISGDFVDELKSEGGGDELDARIAKSLGVQ